MTWGDWRWVAEEVACMGTPSHDEHVVLVPVERAPAVQFWQNPARTNLFGGFYKDIRLVRRTKPTISSTYTDSNFVLWTVQEQKQLPSPVTVGYPNSAGTLPLDDHAYSASDNQGREVNKIVGHVNTVHNIRLPCPLISDNK
jgi:hypothetical protein